MIAVLRRGEIMKVNTSRFGEVEVQEDLIFDFAGPILGYEEYKLYTIIDNNPESPFKWLQSVETEDLAFPVTVPGYFGLDYQFSIPEEEVKRLEITNSNDILIVNIVNIPNDRPQDSTINLAGPVVINTESRKAMQLVLSDPNFPVKHRLFETEVPANKPQMV